MEILVLVGFGLLAFAFIDRQHAAMRRMLKARIKENERRNP